VYVVVYSKRNNSAIVHVTNSEVARIYTDIAKKPMVQLGIRKTKFIGEN
jgi:hypothetical protein